MAVGCYCYAVWDSPRFLPDSRCSVSSLVGPLSAVNLDALQVMAKIWPSARLPGIYVLLACWPYVDASQRLLSIETST